MNSLICSLSVIPRRPPIWAILSSSCLEVRVLRLSNSFHSWRTCSEASPVVFSTPVIRSDILRSSSTDSRALPTNPSKREVAILALKTLLKIEPNEEVFLVSSSTGLTLSSTAFFTDCISPFTSSNRFWTFLSSWTFFSNNSVPGVRSLSSEESFFTSLLSPEKVSVTSFPLILITIEEDVFFAIVLYYLFWQR